MQEDARGRVCIPWRPGVEQLSHLLLLCTVRRGMRDAFLQGAGRLLIQCIGTVIWSVTYPEFEPATFPTTVLPRSHTPGLSALYSKISQILSRSLLTDDGC
jgi:hypothetical protein